MKPISRYILLALGGVILLSPLLYWITGIGQIAPDLAAEVAYDPDGGLINSPKAEALRSLTLPMRLQRLLIYPVLLLAFQLSGGALWLRGRLESSLDQAAASVAGVAWLKKLGRFKRGGRWLPPRLRRRLSGYDLPVIVLFILLLHGAIFLLYLPFDFYRSLILAHQFGLSTQTVSGWWGDWGKSVAIILLTTGLIWTAFYSLVRLFPRRWPLPGGALLLLFSLVFALLAPILITPLFYEVTPLNDPALRARILALAERAGMPVDEVYVIDASTKTTQVNAYVAGFGRAQRMVLYDTLLRDYTPDQIEVVLAHELGHWYYGHVFWSVLGLGAAGWLGLFGLRWFVNRTWRPLGLRGPADVAGLPHILAVVSLAALLSLPLQNGVSRYAENQADRFALTASQKPEAFTTLFIQLAEQNLSPVKPPAWEKIIFYTHPPISDRVQQAETWPRAGSVE